MYLEIKKKKLEIKECTSLKERFKSLKFVLEPIDYIVKIPNTRWVTTYFFCQRVDIIVTNQENKIERIGIKIKSEKRKFLGQKKNVYYLPINTAEHFKIGDIIKEKK